ncbi:MAG: tyrosine--tRNA ligase [Eubacteriales bacterium]|nr:tyrosine--tRNA ligase [Eubacteriales bacterium]
MRNLIPDGVSKYDNVYDVLKERGFIEQVTDEEKVRELLGKEKIKFYIGFDPTADCLHVGHFMQIIVMMWMIKYGHTPVALLGGGTGMVGDPSGRTDMRKMMDVDTIDENCRQFKKLFDRFLEFDDEWEYSGNKGVYQPGKENREPIPGKAVSVNNAEWLRPLNYIEFVRSVGVNFNVNTMLRSEAFKQRMARESGLSFFEFNYMLMQAYDFMVMARDIGVKMEFGGNDQWSNIIAGVDLTRKMCDKEVYGMTFSLLTNSEGKKMGKTAKGALWLSADRTSPFEFFQYWRNIDDADVNKCLRMLTFLPMDEIAELTKEGADLNHAKEVLAYKVTELVHGTEEADAALKGAKAAFGGTDNVEDLPSTEMDAQLFRGEGTGLLTVLKDLGLIASNSEGFRLVKQGGVTVNGEKPADPKMMLNEASFKDGALVIRKGKKKIIKVVMK